MMVAAMVLFLAAAPAEGATAIGVKFLDAGTGGVCAIRTNQTLWCWGDDEVGSVGDGGPTGTGQIRPSPVRVRSGHGFLTGMTSVAVGAGTTCARRNDGTAWCWGYNERGQIGDGTTGGAGYIRLFATEVKNGHTPLTGVVSITIGGWQDCALRTTHTVWCWGGDYAGQLGDGTYGDINGNRLEPVEVRTPSGPFTNVKAIAAGSIHTCALRTDGTVWCWGFDAYGQLGDGTTGDPDTAAWPYPVEVVGPTGGHLHGVTGIAAGHGFTCALRNDSSVWCWGDNQYGQLGDGAVGGGSLHIRFHPVRVLTANGPLTDVRQIDAGSDHMCARRGDASMWCWGSNGDGQLGTGDATDAHKAVRVLANAGVAFRNVAKVSVGANSINSCALTVDKTAWCWGYGGQGAIGDGTGYERYYPTKVTFP